MLIPQVIIHNYMGIIFIVYCICKDMHFLLTWLVMDDVEL